MTKIQKMALNEVKQKSDVISTNLYDSKSNLVLIKNTLMHCDLNMSKEAISELIMAVQKAIVGVENSAAAGKIISNWADALDENK